MHSQSQLHRLGQIYELYAHHVENRAVACQRGCAACCTRNVTMTGLETFRIHESLEAGHRSVMAGRIASASDLDRFIPQITINGIADGCAAGDALPEEVTDPAWSPCPLLVDDECSIYPNRPFHCRCMLSRHDCRHQGFAEIPELWIAENNLFLQVIEHLDHNGTTGNLIDMLGGITKDRPAHQIANRPARILMVAPECRSALAPLLASLNAIVGQ